ncbi:hypothetical protein STEG23_009528, partial [Scotinomys teguina]
MDTWEVVSRESAKFGRRILGASAREGLSSHGTNERFYPALLGHTTRQNHYRALLKITGIPIFSTSPFLIPHLSLSTLKASLAYINVSISEL